MRIYILLTLLPDFYKDLPQSLVDQLPSLPDPTTGVIKGPKHDAGQNVANFPHFAMMFQNGKIKYLIVGSYHEGNDQL